MSERFAVGDIVYLKSGGPPMCIEEPYQAGDHYSLVWIAPDGHKQEAVWPGGVLSTAPAYWWPSPSPLPAPSFQAAAANIGWPQHIDPYKTICQLGQAAQGAAMQMNR